MAQGKKKRDSKRSNGTGVGARKTHLTPIQLVLMGKGVAHKGLGPGPKPKK